MSTEDKASSFRAGMAQVDITPTTDICLAGEVGWFRPGRYVHDPLYARAIVLADGNATVCLVTLDLTIVTEDWAQKIREYAARRLNTSVDAVMVHATQVHAAPALGSFMCDRDFHGIPDDLGWMLGGDPRYADFAYERITKVIDLASERMEPARIRAGSGIEGRVQFNRRAINHEGKAQMPGPHWQAPLGPTYMRYIEGPIDPEVGVIVIQGPGPQVRGLILHHTAHPVHVFPEPVISADWPGAWAQQMRDRVGDDCVPLVINGCCGNINPWDPFDPDFKSDHRRAGKLLAEVTENVMKTLDTENSSSVSFLARRIELAIREPEPELLAFANDMLTKHPTPLWTESGGYAAYEGARTVGVVSKTVHPDWMKAMSIKSLQLQRDRDKSVNYEIQIFRIGRIAIVGVPGEPFVEGQLQIKMNSPTFPTYVAHCCNMYCGYIPIPDAIPRGGHECETRFWAKLMPDALERIVDETTRMLREGFAST